VQGGVSSVCPLRADVLSVAKNAKLSPTCIRFMSKDVDLHSDTDLHALVPAQRIGFCRWCPAVKLPRNE
jgi:hypothetical protein